MNEAYYSCIQEAFTEHLLYAILFAIKRYEDVKINYLQFYQQSLNMSCHVWHIMIDIYIIVILIIISDKSNPIFLL